MIYRIFLLDFRSEVLASIVAVSNFSIKTKKGSILDGNTDMLRLFRAQVLEEIALANNDIAFKVISDGKIILCVTNKQ
jgi:DNA mismatch repair ATPase MutL